MPKNLHKLFYRDYFTDVNSANSEILNSELVPLDSPVSEIEGFKVLRFKVLYPGLVTGTGLPHEASEKGEFKSGLHLDWTYGMPVIYGSSVKGVLRKYFQNFYTETNTNAVVQDIFGSAEAGKGGDVFFDAVVVSAPKNKPLVSDSITPHNKGVFAEPVPLPFVKIAPGSVLEFRFKLKDNRILDKGKTLAIFSDILTSFGIGAKTNVGYGQLKKV